MNQKTKSSYLEEAIELLIQHFGADLVHAAIVKTSNGSVGMSERITRRRPSTTVRGVSPSLTRTIESLRQTDEEKYRLLTDFHRQLSERTVLPESQDIRQYAQLIGIKEIEGKSRKDMISKLMRYLLEKPIDKLYVDIKKSQNVSEKQRQKGYSVLTDKLLGDE